MKASKMVLQILVLAGLFSSGQPARADSDFTLETASQAVTNSGDPKALYFLAKSYSKGNGVPRDDAKAADYMRQAADKDYAFAQNDLGSFYARGVGVKTDFEEAAKWYRKAAENGDSLAQYSMGMVCFEGRGVPRDVQQSLNWYRKSANQAQPDAMLALGTIYMNGAEGVPMDSKEALKWFEKAGKAGRPDAFNSMGFIYQYGGTGVDRDLHQAFTNYNSAAEKGYGKAMTNLGRMYREGIGVDKDYVEAYKWFLLATQYGDGVAGRYKTELEGNNPLGRTLLTQPQFTAARRSAQDWSASHKPERKTEIKG